jgi:hypothetical protein
MSMTVPGLSADHSPSTLLWSTHTDVHFQAYFRAAPL